MSLINKKKKHVKTQTASLFASLNKELLYTNTSCFPIQNSPLWIKIEDKIRDMLYIFKITNDVFKTINVIYFIILKMLQN